MPQDRLHMFAARLLALALASSGCGSDSPTAPADGEPAPAVRIDDEPPGANCPEGGRAVHEGRDDDGDGTLDPGEIDATAYVCAEQGDLPELLTTREEEPPGEHCPHGGMAVRSGLDLDGDGTLDAREAADATYVCAGAPPEQPEQPEPTPERLVRIDEELAGPNCIAGGTTVHTGLDDNGDGTLEDEEIDATEHVCGASLVGDYTVASVDDLAALDGIRVITGTLTILAELATAVSLRDLEYVGGSIEVRNAYLLERLELPALVQVGGDFSVFSVSGLRSLSLPSLVRMGGALTLSSVRQLAAVELPALTEVGGRVEPGVDAITVNAEALTTLAMPSLRRSGGIYLRGTALERVAFPALTEAGGFVLWNGLAVQALELPVLREVRGDLILWGVAAGELALSSLVTVAGSLSVADAQNAARLSLPELWSVGDTFVVARCAQLTTLDVPRLASAPRVIVRDLATLTSFSLPAMEAAEEQVGVWYNAALTSFSLPGLRRTRWLSVQDNPRLTGLGGLAQLESVSALMTLDDNAALEDLSGLASLSYIGGILEIRGNHAMTRVGLARLERAESIDIGRVGVAGNDRLEVVDMPALRRVDGLGISSNKLLTDLALPSLTRVPGALSVAWNPALPQCEAEALAAQLTGQPEQIYLGSNDDDGTCE